RQVEIVVAAAQALRRPSDLRPEMPVIGAAFADLVDHTAVRATVLGAVAADEGFLLLDSAVWQRETAEVGQWFAGEISVHVVRVFGHARATERNQVAEEAGGTGNGARGQ